MVLVIITRRPEDVLDEHARLAERLGNPSEAVADFFRYFMQDTADKQDGQVSSMYYPVARRGATVTHEQGAQLARILGQGLRFAVTYEVTAEMTTAMRGVYAETVGRIFHLDEAEMPCEQGFAWLDDGWDVTDVQGKPITIRAVSWDRTVALTDPEPGEPMPGVREVPCARVSVWSHKNDDVAAGRDTAEHAAMVHTKLGTLTLTHTTLMPFEMRLTVTEGNNVESADSVLGLVHVLWMFLGMEITVARREPVPRAFRRRALRSLRHGEVHVVLLRRAARDPDEEHAYRPVDWTCRWVVQGHWRHAERMPGTVAHHGLPSGPDKHCASCGGKLSWVRPYLKGPDGMPLKVSKTLYKLAR